MRCLCSRSARCNTACRYLFVALWFDMLASSTPPVPFPFDAGNVFSSFMAACRCGGGGGDTFYHIIPFPSLLMQRGRLPLLLGEQIQHVAAPQPPPPSGDCQCIAGSSCSRVRPCDHVRCVPPVRGDVLMRVMMLLSLYIYMRVMMLLVLMPARRR